MIAYLDASVVLRLVLGEPEPLKGWRKLDAVVASALTEVECLRTLDRLTQMGLISADALPERRITVYELLESVEIIAVGPAVLRRAAQPFPTPLGTLDALHLATAMSWRDARNEELTMATHDRALAAAARASGFAVIGI